MQKADLNQRKTKIDHPWRSSRLSPGPVNALENAMLIELLIEHRGNITRVYNDLKAKGYDISRTSLRARYAKADMQDALAEAIETAKEMLVEKMWDFAEGKIQIVDNLSGDVVNLPPDRAATETILKALDPEIWDPRIRALKYQKQLESNGEDKQIDITYEIKESKNDAENIRKKIISTD